MSTEDTLEDLADVVAVVGRLPLGELGGVLTDEEKSALDVARRIVGTADLVAGLTGDATVKAVVGVLQGLPALVELVGRLVAQMRHVAVRAAELDITIEELGPGVAIESTE